MKLTYVIVTRNRRDSLLRTLAHLEANTHLGGAWETIVVDNASEDDTADVVQRQFPDTRVISLPENEGMPARNHGIAAARGRFVAFLDDDSYPTGTAIPDALGYMARRPKVAAVVARVELPDGRGCEAPAFPTVTMGGASIVRKTTLDQVGGFAPEFFRQAEEYELSFRLWAAGFRVERFEDVVFRHDKAPGGRPSALVHRMDLRNNLIVVERYLPQPLRRAYRHDWIRRYAALATHEGHADAVNTALHEARVWARRERQVGRRTLAPTAVEGVFGLEAQAKAVAAWAKRQGVKRVVLADYAKNAYAAWQACRRAGLVTAALADDRPAFAGMTYRGLPILPARDAVAAGADGVVVANTNPAQVDGVCDGVRRWFAGPVLRLWEPQYLRPPVVHPAAGAEAPRRASA